MTMEIDGENIQLLSWACLINSKIKQAFLPSTPQKSLRTLSLQALFHPVVPQIMMKYDNFWKRLTQTAKSTEN